MIGSLDFISSEQAHHSTETEACLVDELDARAKEEGGKEEKKEGEGDEWSNNAEGFVESSPSSDHWQGRSEKSNWHEEGKGERSARRILAGAPPE